MLVGSLNTHFHENYDLDITSALDRALKENAYKSTSTLVTAKFDSKRENVIKTSVIGNSGYMILRPTTDDDDRWVYEQVYKSTDQYE